MDQKRFVTRSRSIALLADKIELGDFVDGAQLGIALGTVLGRRLTNDPFGQVVASAGLSTLLGVAGEFLDTEVFGSSPGTLSTRFFQRDPNTGHVTGFNDLGGTVLANIEGAGIGALSSYLTAELVKAVGLNGVPAEIADSVGGAVVNQIITNLASPATRGTPFAGVSNGVVIVNAIGSYLGTKLASEIHTFNSVGGQIGSAVGSIAGGFAATVSLAAVKGVELGAAGVSFGQVATAAAQFAAAQPLAAVAIVAAVVLLDTLLGGLIGSIFGGTPRSGADAEWDASKQQFVVANVYAKKGGSKDAARGLAGAVAQNLNTVLSATGSLLLNPDAVQAGNYGMRKTDYVYRPASTRDKDAITARFSGKSGADKLIRLGSYLALESMVGSLAGGDVYVKRALAADLADAGGTPGQGSAGAAGAFDMTTLSGDLSVAGDYESYLASSTAIDALIAADPTTSFAAGWLVTLARVSELGLDKRAATDWTGGYQAFLDEAGDGALDGKALLASQLRAGIDPTTGARYWSVTDADGASLGFVEDVIEAGAATSIVGTSAGETIDLRGRVLADQRGYTVDGRLRDDIAVTGTDFTAAAGTLSFTPSDASKSISVFASNDAVTEPDERLQVRLSGASGMTVMGPPATVTIVAASALPTLSVGRSFAGEADGWLNWRIALSKAPTTDVTLQLALADGTATGGGVDYGATDASNLQIWTDSQTGWRNATSVTLTSSMTRVFVRTAVKADNGVDGLGKPTGVEGNETVMLSATVTAGASALANGADSATGIGTIVDGTGTGPYVWADDAVVHEGSSVAINVSRSAKPAGVTATVGYATTDQRQLTIDVAADVDAGDGNDTVHASDLGDTIVGGAGNDTLYGGRLDDWLLGGDGDDSLDAGAADQAKLGGDGNYLDGGAGNDTLKGREGSDWLEGGDGVDTLTGGDGDDILAAGAGIGDHSYGGAGADQYIVRLGDGADFAEDGTGAVGGSDSLTTAIAAKNANPALKDWLGTGIYSGSGAPYNGDDRVVLGAGIGLGDIMLKRSGTPSAPGMDLIVIVTQGGVATGDQLTLTGWFDSFKRVEWLEFADGQAVRISDFVSFTVGTAGNDVLIGTNGNDFVVGGDGDDHLQLLGGDDVGIGGRGRDEIGGDDGQDILVGGADADFVLGGSGNDVLSGDGGGDDLNGGAGDDIVSGGRGNDMIAGAAGNDIFRISRGDGRDTIIDDYAGSWDTVWTSSGGWNAAQGYAWSSTTNIVTKNGSEIVYDGSNWLGRFNYDYTTASSTGTLYRLVPALSGQVGKDNSTTDNDALEFALGINIQDLVLRRSGNDLLLGVSSENAQTGTFASIEDQIILKDWFVSTTTNSPIERFVFAATGMQTMTATEMGVQGTDAADVLTGTASVDWITGGSGDDTIDGGAANDILNGNAGQDTLKGSAGDDIIYGGADDDVLVGGAGKDLLSGGEGNDTASYAGSTATISAYLGTAAMNVGDALGDTYASIANLTGGDGADRLGGDDDDNVLAGGLGTDVLVGGLGNDVYVYDPSSGSKTIQDGRYVVQEAVNASGALTAGYTTNWTSTGTTVISGTTYYTYRLVVTGPGAEAVYDDSTFKYTSQMPVAPAPSGWALTGWKNGFTRSNNNQQIIREKIDATVDGGSEDVLEYGKGISLSDLSLSWSGNDLTLSGQGTVKIVNQAIANQRVETLQLNDGLAASLTNLRLNASGLDNVADLILGTSAADTLNGLSGDDVISGGAGDDALNGGDGDDVLEGGAGADTLTGGLGSDTARYVRSTGVTVNLNLSTAQATTSNGDAAGDVLSGIENVTGSIAGNDVLTGNANDNRLNGLDGNDTLTGNAGDDILVGEVGDDNLTGGDGDDGISGGDGNDVALGGNGNDLIDGGAGIDALHGDAGNDTLSGGGDNDNLYGDIGDDVLGGGDGNDALWGSDGDDKLSGDAGDDTLRGEAGNDVYVFSADSGADVVFDAAGVNEIGFDASVNWRSVWLARVGNDLKISLVGSTAQIMLSNYYAATTPTIVRRIATQTHAIYLDYAQPLITQMSAMAPVAPATVPAAVATTQSSYWWAGGLAIPVVATIALVADEDVATALRGTSAVDHDQNIIGYAIGAQGQHGVATINPTTGQFSYLAAPNYFGTDSFTIIVSDADAHSVEQTVNVTINPVDDAPTDITISLAPPSASGIPENTSGVIVGDLSAIDVDLASVSDFGQSTFTTADSRFEVVGGKTLKLRAGGMLDYETTPTTSVVVRATDRNGAGLWLEKTLTFAVADRVDVLNGTSGADTLTGAQGVDQIYGYDGNDTLRGGFGNDVIDGGNGNDSIGGDDGDDKLSGGTGSDAIYGGNGNDTLDGGSQNDTLVGGAGDDLIDGGADVDSLFGSGGADTLMGGDGDDGLAGGPGADRLIGGSGWDIASYYWTTKDVTATAGITVNASNPALNTGDAVGDSYESVESLGGTDFADTLTGSTYLTAIWAGGGNDIVSGAGANDDLHGQDGSDVLYGLDGDDLIDGGEMNDVLYGGAGNDRLNGGNGDDQLFAEDGDDVLDGGDGADLMIGGAGSDTYIVVHASGMDTINNYHTEAGDNDVLGYQDAIADKDLWFQHVGNDLVISVVGTGTATTIAGWYTTAGMADQTNYRIKFIEANTTRVINVEGLVSLMTGYQKPATLAARDTLMANTAYLTSWQTYWGNNPAPVLSPIANQTITEGLPFTLTVTATDTLDGTTPSAPNSVTLVAKVYNTAGFEDHSLISSVAFGSPDNAYRRSATITPSAYASSGTARIKIWAVDAGGRYSDEQVFDVSVAARANMPSIDVAAAGNANDGWGTFDRGATIPLNISVGFPDQDGSEAHTILISGVPAGLTLNKGSFDGGTGTWMLSPDDLADLRLGGPASYSQDLTLNIKANAVETSNGDTAISGSTSLQVYINAAPLSVAILGSFVENSPYGAGGATLVGNDPDGDVLNYSLTDNPGNLFRLDSSTGALTVLTANPALLDYEASAYHSYSIGVRATDSRGLSYESNVSVPVLDQNERPYFISSSNTASIIENAAAGIYVTTVAAFDPDAAGSSYGSKRYYFENTRGSVTSSQDGTRSLSSDTQDGRFHLDPVNGVVTVNGFLDYEAANAFTYNVAVWDQIPDNGRMNSAQVSISLVDVNEAPTINPANISVDEQIANPAVWQWQLNASDPDSDPNLRRLYYSLAGPNSEYFLINSSTGQIALQRSLDFEDGSQPKTFNLTAGVWDQGNGGGNFVQNSVTFNVRNVNEPPAPTATHYSLSGGIPANTRIGIITPNDPDQDANITYKITGCDSLPVSAFYMSGSAIYINQNYQTTGGTRDVISVNVSVSDGTFSVPTTVSMAYWTSHNYPIVLDLDGDGVELTSLSASSVRFDMDGDMDRDVTGWAGPDDALLTIDLNKNGIIDDTSEIAFQPDVVGAVSDLEGLRAYDTNSNGLIDDEDENFFRLRVWQDRDQNGVSSPDELRTLSDAGIRSVGLTMTSVYGMTDGKDNALYALSYYTKQNGETGLVGDASFAFASEGDVLGVFGPHLGMVLINLGIDNVSLVDRRPNPITLNVDGRNDQAVLSWVGDNDAVLVMDLDGDRQITSAAELGLGGEVADISPLRNLDSNRDGRVDVADSGFANLLLWHDVDQDGVSTASELKTLNEFGIKGFDLSDDDAGPFTIAKGESKLAGSPLVEYDDGHTGRAADALLAIAETEIAAPVILDFDGDGGGLVPLAGSSTRFDMNGDGIADQTGWIEPGDAFLALDRNGNGGIDQIMEISFVGDLAGAMTDLEGLAAFDSNADGLLDDKDARFGDFRLWFDGNADGLTDAGELKTLGEAGVTAISLRREATGETANAGANIVYNIGGYARVDGTAGRVLDAGLAFVAEGAPMPSSPADDPTAPPPPASDAGTPPADGGDTAPAAVAFPRIVFQASNWESGVKRYRLSSTGGTMQVTPARAEGVLDPGAGALAPASILTFADRSFGMLSTILVDLDGDGLEAKRMDKTSASFDMDGDGSADDTGWVSGGDGLLVIDRNGDGKITNPSEISFLSEKADAKSAWDALSTLDSNKDGKLNSADARFGELKIWVDRNRDARTDAGELKGLGELGISEISLAATKAEAETKLGHNAPLSTATFKREDGVTRTIGNVVLAFDPSSKKPQAPQPAGTVATQTAAAQLLQAMSTFGASSSDDPARGPVKFQQNDLDWVSASAA